MLGGKKPMAAFSFIEGFEVDCVERYLRMFDRYVAAGRFTRQEVVSKLPDFDDRLHHQVFYTLPGEEWRANAWLELFAEPGPWSDDRERRQGDLLGYEIWQTDVWLTQVAIWWREDETKAKPIATASAG
jgi:hypothetical protein